MTLTITAALFAALFPAPLGDAVRLDQSAGSPEGSTS